MFKNIKMVVTPIESICGGRGSNSALRLDNKLNAYETEIDNKLLKEFRSQKKIRYTFPKLEKKIVVKILRLKYQDLYDIEQIEPDDKRYGITLIFSEKNS